MYLQKTSDTHLTGESEQVVLGEQKPVEILRIGLPRRWRVTTSGSRGALQVEVLDDSKARAAGLEARARARHEREP